ncbi:unnamed protein product [Phytophthora fragariaefolia]|uniref:Unnamed protein product n=1 Tax=Phytophthora fragariaefolia TaxID=1490495 RepID=A0A9W6XWD1_9STRA|nr:unnamed protein product [Phytophthora fragariaefolia]
MHMSRSNRSQTDDGLEPLARRVAGVLEVPRARQEVPPSESHWEIHQRKATLLVDSGAEVSILDVGFARKAGCYIDDSQELECEGVGKNPYMGNGRTRVKHTLAGSLVYSFDVWIGPPTGGQDLILGMDFMVPTGVRLDLADGSPSLPDEIRIQLAGQRPLYGENVLQVKLGDHCNLEARGTFEARKGFILAAHRKRWTRGERWVPSVVAGLEKTRYLKITNISDQKLALLGSVCDSKEDAYLERPGLRCSSCGAASTAGRSTVPREAIGPDQECAIGEDDHSIQLPVGVPDRDHHQEKWRGYPTLYRLQAGEQFDAIDDVSHADDQRSLGRLGQGALILLSRYGQWLLGDNGLYGHLRISPDQDRSKPVDVFEAGEPEPNPKPSVLGRRSYIDDILVTATIWDSMCDKGQKTARRLPTVELVDQRGQVFLGPTESRLPRPSGDFHEIGHQEANDSSGRGTGGVVASPEQADRWTRAKAAFTIPKAKCGSTPILKHFDPNHTPVTILYASQWAIYAALVHENDGVYWPVTFTSRRLKSNELDYGIVDKEALALLRMLEVNYTLLTTRSIVVLTRHSTLAWLANSTGFQGRLGNWAALLSEWTLEIRKCSKGEDEFLGVIAASITPRAEVDEAVIVIAPVKEPRQTIVLPPPTVEEDEKLLVASFDGAARTKRNSGAYSAIIWKLPEWTIVSAASGYSPDLTVNEAEYRGLLLRFDLLFTMDRWRIVICDDSNLVIPQMRGEIACKAPGLQLLRKKVLDRLSGWSNHDFLHVKRKWNQSTDKLASAALQQEEGVTVTSDDDKKDLITLNRLDELLQPRNDSGVACVTAVTRSTRRRRPVPSILQEAIVQRMRSERIIQAQDEEK